MATTAYKNQSRIGSGPFACIGQCLRKFALPLTTCFLQCSVLGVKAMRLLGKVLIVLAMVLMLLAGTIYFYSLLPKSYSYLAGPPTQRGISSRPEQGGAAKPPRFSSEEEAVAAASGKTDFSFGLVVWYALWPVSIMIFTNMLFNYCSAVLVKNYSMKVVDSSIEEGPTEYPTCSKCNCHKPDRCRHCSICNRCVFKMDHHCPWLDNCVGNNNHRYFFLFLAYLSAACIVFTVLAVPYLPECFDLSRPWTEIPFSRYTFSFTALATAAVGAMVAGMTIWNTYLICRGRTQLEWAYSDANDLKKYDLGVRANLRVFFNTFTRPWYFIFLPIRVAPYSDGYAYPISDAMIAEDFSFYALN